MNLLVVFFFFFFLLPEEEEEEGNETGDGQAPQRHGQLASQPALGWPKQARRQLGAPIEMRWRRETAPGMAVQMSGKIAKLAILLILSWLPGAFLYYMPFFR